MLFLSIFFVNDPMVNLFLTTIIEFYFKSYICHQIFSPTQRLWREIAFLLAVFIQCNLLYFWWLLDPMVNLFLTTINEFYFKSYIFHQIFSPNQRLWREIAFLLAVWGQSYILGMLEKYINMWVITKFSPLKWYFITYVLHSK